MRTRFLEFPRLRIWHLLGLVAVIAAVLALARFRTEAYEPHAFAVSQARFGGVEERRHAIGGLWEGDLKRSDLIPTLLAALLDADPIVRRSATRSLGFVLARGVQERYVDPRAEEAKVRLAQLLHDPDLKTCIESAHALVMLDDRSEPLRDCLIKLARGVTGEDSETRREAVRLLWAFCSDAEATALTVAAMSDPNPQFREGVAFSLGRWGTLGANAIPDSVIQALLKGLDDEAPRVRASSARNLAKMRSRAHAAIPAIVRLLDDREAVPRMRAAEALASFGLDAESALPALRELIARETDRTVLPFAKEAVKSIDMAVQNFREEVLPALISDLSEDSHTRRRVAARELGRHGPAARQAIPRLHQLLSDPDASVRKAASAALQQIEAEEESSPPIVAPDR